MLPCSNLVTSHACILGQTVDNMSTFPNPTTPFQHKPTTQQPNHRRQNRSLQAIRASFSGEETPSRRRDFVRTLLATSIALVGLQASSTPPAVLAQSWGVRSFIKEHFFEPGLSPEDAVARIRQTAEGLHSLREMLEYMSWRYVLFYIRLKWAYLNQDMKNALSLVPESRRPSYVKTANELVDNIAEFDYYVRTPKVYESYVYYEKTLKSIDEPVEFLV